MMRTNMIKRIATRTGSGSGGCVRAFRGAPAAIGTATVITVSLIVAGIIAASFGRSEAAEATTAVALAQPPIVLAGRWSGRYYGYGRHESRTDCADTGCTLTYDIVACKDGWCGIAVKDDKTCGPVGVRLTADEAKEGGSAFKGKLELAKGSAPYTVEAWYRSEEGGASNLHFLGDTGPELLLMRRSFPFEADLARTGDATCTLDKATS
jgi:hypothetical protein